MTNQPKVHSQAPRAKRSRALARRRILARSAPSSLSGASYRNLLISLDASSVTQNRVVAPLGTSLLQRSGFSRRTAPPKRTRHVMNAKTSKAQDAAIHAALAAINRPGTSWRMSIRQLPVCQSAPDPVSPIDVRPGTRCQIAEVVVAVSEPSERPQGVPREMLPKPPRNCPFESRRFP